MRLERAGVAALPEKGIVAVAGAGGKTTLAHSLADYYLAQGRRVFLTTSTHMLKEADTLTDLSAALDCLGRSGYVFAGALDPNNSLKIRAFPPEAFRTLTLAADVTIVEADGARGLPFKAPRPGEPVILPGTAAVVLVMGMDACGFPLRKVCFNPEGAAMALRLDPYGNSVERGDFNPEGAAMALRLDPYGSLAERGDFNPEGAAWGLKPGMSADRLGEGLILTEDRMLEIYEKTYVRRLMAKAGGGGDPAPALYLLKNFKEGQDHLFDSFFRILEG